MGRTTWYETIEEMQKDLDAFLETYNRRRPHQGRGMKGTPALRGLQGRDPPEPHLQTLGQEGGEEAA